MSFLSPLWLALGAAAAIPIMLHLLRLRRGIRVEFPAIQFLLRAEREHRREVKLRNLALMLLRVLIVSTLALAAARPLGRTGGSGHAPAAIGIVLDNSMSSGAMHPDGSSLEKLQRSAAAILDAATPADRIWVLTADGEVSAGDVATARSALERARPIGGAGDLVGAVERAVAVTQSSGMNASTVVVLTDGQASQWSRAARVGRVPVAIVAVGDALPKNRAVREARPAPMRWVPRGAIEVAVTSADSSDVRVALGERTLVRSTLGPGGAITVRGSAETAGWQSGRVEIAPDELRGDDVRHFAVFAGRAPSVRVDASAGQFARGAIETLADGGRVDLGGSIIVTGAENATKKPVLAFAPVDPVRAGAANRALAAAGIPWKFGEARREEATVRGGELDGIAVRMRYAMTPTGASIVDTLATAEGDPWIVAGEGYVLVASPLDPSATNLPVSAPLLPWIESIIARYLLADGGRVVSASPLASVSVPLGVDELVGTEQPPIAVQGRNVRAPGRAGVYWMRRAGSVVGALVVNPEPSESDLTPLDSAGLASHIAGPETAVIRPDDSVAGTVFSTAARRPLAGVLLAILAVLFILESLVARETPVAAGRTS